MLTGNRYFLLISAVQCTVNPRAYGEQIETPKDANGNVRLIPVLTGNSVTFWVEYIVWTVNPRAYGEQ